MLIGHRRRGDDHRVRRAAAFLPGSGAGATDRRLLILGGPSRTPTTCWPTMPRPVPGRAALFVAAACGGSAWSDRIRARPAWWSGRPAFREAAARLGASVARARGADSDYAGGNRRGPRPVRHPAVAGRRSSASTTSLPFGVMDHARSAAGLNVPSDLAVIGFDDVPQAAWHSYAPHQLSPGSHGDGGRSRPDPGFAPGRA